MVDLSRCKITFLAGTLGCGGAERQLYYIVRSLKQLDAQVSIIHFQRDNFWVDAIRALDIPVIWLGNHSNKLNRLKTLMSILRYLNPDIIQSQHSYINKYAALSAFFLKRRSVGAFRSDGLHDHAGSNSLISRVTRYLNNILVANSNTAIKYLSEIGVKSERLFYLPNVLDTDMFSPSKTFSNIKYDVIGVGKLYKVKRFDRFLRIIAELRKNIPIQANIVGSGPLLRDLQQYACYLNVDKFVRFHKNNDNIIDLYHQSSCLLHVSDWEGTPNVVMEAMACGVPVVATDTGDTAQLLGNGIRGVVSSPQNEYKLIAGIIEYILNPEYALDMAQKSRDYIKNNHDIKILPQYLGNLYDKMI